jgi:hypothetical protein
MEIDKADFAEECVRQGLNCGANPHYILGVAQLRSGISDGTVGAEVGPFRLTQADWNAHCTDSAFGLTFLPTDITDPDMQIPVFAVMARRAFDAFETANNRTPSAKELYLQQFPAAPAATLSTDLKAALDATAGLIDPAAAAVLDDEQAPPPKITDPDQPVSSSGTGVFNQEFDAFFTALVPGGFFSSDPNKAGVPRSIRTNNPGALDKSTWQETRPGFVGVTADDGHGNQTTIYCAPEYGVAAWYHLLAAIYNFSEAGSFTINLLARRYAGQGAAQAAVDEYVRAWCVLSEQPLNGESVVRLSDDTDMLNLARAMYKNEAGVATPLSNNQILFGIRNERSNSMPTPPRGPATLVAAGSSGGSSAGA